jgi:hypothetical protein
MITAHIASLAEREESLKRVICALLPQVDRIYVALNNYQVKPDWLTKERKVYCELLDNSLMDTAKFLFIHEVEGPCLVWDDDLVANSRVVRYMELGLRKHGGAVSLHGKTYPRPPESFKKWSANYRCLGNVLEDVPCDIIGTGVMMLDNRQVKLDLSVFDHPGLADITFSRLCHKQGVPMTVLKHHANYLTYIAPAETIWRTTKDFSLHTKLIKEFLI